MIATIVETITIFVLRMLTSFANSLFYTSHVIFFIGIRRSWTNKVLPIGLVTQVTHLLSLVSRLQYIMKMYLLEHLFKKKYYVGLYIVYVVKVEVHVMI